jgi:ribose transport system ATP-binding protein
MAASQNIAVLTAALTGPIATKADNPSLPTTPQEIVAEAIAAHAAGAAVVHIHLRDEDGHPSADRAIADRILGLITDAGCEVLVQLSTGVGLTVPYEERMQIVEAQPTMATLNVASMSFASGEFRNPPDGVRRLASRMRELGIKAELEIYDFGHLDLALSLLAEGLLATPASVLDRAGSAGWCGRNATEPRGAHRPAAGRCRVAGHRDRPPQPGADGDGSRNGRQRPHRHGGHADAAPRCPGNRQCRTRRASRRRRPRDRARTGHGQAGSGAARARRPSPGYRGGGEVTPTESSAVPARVTIRNASKTFGRQRVLKSVDLEIRAGEVHALLGHNGSGKSTLVKLLAGYHAPDAGAELAIDGHAIELGSATAADLAGIRFVHQDLGLIESLDTVDNVFLGVPFPRRAGGRIDWAAARRETAAVLAELGFRFDLSLPVRSLTPAQRTAVAVARATRERDPQSRAVVFDEPTAALPANEVETLFSLIRALQARGLAILYISHHLDEIFELADRVTVLRDGVVVEARPVSEVTERQLVRAIVGEDPGSAPVSVRPERDAETPAVLTLSALHTRRLTDISLEVCAREIVGVAGIDGSGREALAAAVFGAIGRRGEVRVAGHHLPALRPDLAVRLGAGYVPSDRVGDASLASMSVQENLTIPRPPSRLGALLDRASERSDAETWIERLAIRPARSTATMETLSGGNQQKVIIARWLRLSPQLLILDEPTKGVDVGAVGAIWELLRTAADSGLAALVCSSESEELAAQCDRVFVLRRGRLVAELSGDELTADEIDSLSLAEGGDGR